MMMIYGIFSLCFRAQAHRPIHGHVHVLTIAACAPPHSPWQSFKAHVSAEIKGSHLPSVVVHVAGYLVCLRPSRAEHAPMPSLLRSMPPCGAS